MMIGSVDTRRMSTDRVATDSHLNMHRSWNTLIRVAIVLGSMAVAGTSPAQVSPDSGVGISVCAATSNGGSGVTRTCAASPTVGPNTAAGALDFVPNVATAGAPRVNANGGVVQTLTQAQGNTSLPGAT